MITLINIDVVINGYSTVRWIYDIDGRHERIQPSFCIPSRRQFFRHASVDVQGRRSSKVNTKVCTLPVCMPAPRHKASNTFFGDMANSGLPSVRIVS
jgi:hypothetical protein